MRVLFVGHSPHLAGAEYSLLRLIQHMPKTVEISVLAPANGLFEKSIKELGHDFYPLTLNYAFYLKKDNQANFGKFLKTLSESVDSLSNTLPVVDVVHSNTFFIWEGALLAAKWCVPHVWNLREIIMDSPTWSPLLNFDDQFQLMDTFTDHFVCVSRALATKCPESTSQKSVVHNGFTMTEGKTREESRFYFESQFGIPMNAKIVLTTGNFIPEKGHDWMLEVADAVLDKFNDVYFLWVGSHDFSYPEIEKKMRNIRSSNRIICPGHVNGFNQYFKGVDVYALCSETEAFPTTLLEAQYNKVPIVARDCGGAKEIIDLGEQGKVLGLYDQKGFILALENTLNNLNTPLENSFYFTMDKMVEAYVSIYEKAIESYQINPARNVYLSLFLRNGDKFLAPSPILPSLKVQIKLKIKKILGL